MNHEECSIETESPAGSLNLSQEINDIMEYDGNIGIKVKSYEIDNDNDTITIGFLFRNDTGNNTSYSSSYCKDTVFQDGIECSYLYRNQNVDTEIKSGKEITVYKTYSLRDKQTPVEVDFGNYWNDNIFHYCTFDILNTGSKKVSSSAPPTDVEDSFKFNLNSFKDDKAVWIQRGLYFTFCQDIDSQKHYLWEISKLAEQYSLDNGITADEYYRYLNKHWEYTIFPWCFCDKDNIITDFPDENSFLSITGFDEQEKVVTYSMIPFSEYSRYLSPFILSDIPGYSLPETSTPVTTEIPVTTSPQITTAATTSEYTFDDFQNDIENYNNDSDEKYTDYEGICSDDISFELLFTDVYAAARQMGVESYHPADYWCIEWRTGHMSLAFYNNNYDENWNLLDRSEVKRVPLSDISEYLNPELETYSYIRSVAEYLSCPSGVEDSYKTTKFDEMPDAYDYGLYFIFGNDNNPKGHNLWELSLLAELNSRRTDMDADFYYRYLNEHWEYTGDYWYIEDWTSGEPDLVIGEPGETKFMEYARIPYNEYSYFESLWFFQ